jgi:hypothetical protein
MRSTVVTKYQRLDVAYVLAASIAVIDRLATHTTS